MIWIVFDASVYDAERFVFVVLFVYVHLCVCLCMFVYVCVYLCMCMCVFVCDAIVYDARVYCIVYEVELHSYTLSPFILEDLLGHGTVSAECAIHTLMLFIP
jgi:hypothetical protein